MARMLSAAITAMTTAAASADTAAASVAAAAGPVIAAMPKLAASREFARGRRSVATRLGSMLVNPPLTSGSVVPATAARTGVTQGAVWPTTASIESMTAPSTAWLAASAVRR
jgi:hypothetical protein